MNCTGIAASWCPNCGDCTCPYDEAVGYLSRDAEDCPLHSSWSEHCELRYVSNLSTAEVTEPMRLKEPHPTEAGRR